MNNDRDPEYGFERVGILPLFRQTWCNSEFHARVCFVAATSALETPPEIESVVKALDFLFHLVAARAHTDWLFFSRLRTLSSNVTLSARLTRRARSRIYFGINPKTPFPNFGQCYDIDKFKNIYRASKHTGYEKLEEVMFCTRPTTAILDLLIDNSSVAINLDEMTASPAPPSLIAVNRFLRDNTRAHWLSRRVKASMSCNRAPATFSEFEPLSSWLKSMDDDNPDGLPCNYLDIILNMTTESPSTAGVDLALFDGTAFLKPVHKTCYSWSTYLVMNKDGCHTFDSIRMLPYLFARYVGQTHDLCRQSLPEE